MAIAHKRICILADNDIVMDGRIRKIARALGNAGAQVLVIGEGDPSGDQAAQLADEPFDIQIVQRDINDWERALGYSQPRLGREDVWWPLRVAVNLTYSKAKLFLCWARLRTRYSDYREKRFDSRFFNESMLRAAIAFEPDVVHANDVYMGKTAIAIAEQTDCKLVYDSHELFDSYFVSKTKNTLADKRICVLANNEIVLDGRIRKTARALSSAGAQVLVIGEGESRDLRLDAEPFQSIVVPFGFERREQSWWHRALFFARRVLVRIARILLRVLRISIARNPLKARTSPTRLYNANMIEPAVAFAPDIVHVNDVFTGKVALEIAARTDSTIIYDSHELFDGYFTDHEDNALVQ
ncbi:MAG: hypothetical protein FWD93_01160, partial [Coriobacteriia bacterium]|nr:hypothetical protein [Coriobacteriia bacterium]